MKMSDTAKFCLFCSKLPSSDSVLCLIFVKLKSNFADRDHFPFVLPYSTCDCVMIPSRPDYNYFSDQRLENIVLHSDFGYSQQCSHVIVIPRSCSYLDIRSLFGFKYSGDDFVNDKVPY